VGEKMKSGLALNLKRAHFVLTVAGRGSSIFRLSSSLICFKLTWCCLPTRWHPARDVKIGIHWHQEQRKKQIMSPFIFSCSMGSLRALTIATERLGPQDLFAKCRRVSE
jgi:hypothetical protein